MNGVNSPVRRAPTRAGRDSRWHGRRQRGRGVALLAGGVVAALLEVGGVGGSFGGVALAEKGVPAAPAGRSGAAREPRAGAVALKSAPAQTVSLQLPFEGVWGVVQGFDSGDTHVGYAAYALDFVPAENLAQALPEAKRHHLSDFPCFGAPVFAPAGGVVVWARDASPDRPPRRPSRGDPGNVVIVEHAPGEYTELRHLQAGSVRVKVGDRVNQGALVARCGNSGNAKTPHLHVGLLGSVRPIATRPMSFSGYDVLQPDGSWRPGDGVPSRGQILRRTVAGGAPPLTPAPSGRTPAETGAKRATDAGAGAGAPLDIRGASHAPAVPSRFEGKNPGN